MTVIVMAPPTVISVGSGNPVFNGTTAILTVSSNATDLTQADMNTLASWGIGGLVFQTDGNGENFSFSGDSADQHFSGSPGTSQPASGQPYYNQWVYRTVAGYAHNATLSTTVGSGSNGGEISQIATWSSPSAGVLDTGTLTAAFPTSGQVSVAASGSTTALVNYTGISGNSLTGCTYVSGSATGTVATGGVITTPWRINCFATLQGFNTYQSSSNTGFYGPLLGSFNPSYTDPNGHGWTDWYQMCADLGDAMEWMGFDGAYFDNEDAQVDSGSGETTWCAGYWANSFGASTTVAQERAWAQAAGVSIMGAINGGRSGTNGNNYTIINYCSNSGGRLGNFPGGVFTQYYNHYGTTVTIDYQGSKTLAPDTAAIDYSSYLWFMAGMASATTAPVVFGDSAFYNYQWVTTSGLPWYSSVSAAQCWTNAIAADVAGFANVCNGTTIPGFTLPANCYVTPMIWPLDQSTVSGNGQTWTQSVWNSAYPAIWAGAQAGMYLVWQYTGLTYGTGMGNVNYADNTYISPAEPATSGTATDGGGANYTPLGNAPGTT
jgi:hypothetical protein